MIELSDSKDLIGPWVFQRIQKEWHPAGRQVLGLVDGDRVLAGVVFEDCTTVCITTHVAISHTGAPVRRLIFATFNYAFVQLGVNKILGLVNSNNIDALRFDLKLGYKAEAIIPGVYPDGDLVIMVMHRDLCRWIPARYRQAA